MPRPKRPENERPSRGSAPCAKCGKPTPRHDRVYCDDCNAAGAVSAAVSESNRRRWQQYKAQGYDPLHGGNAALLRGQAIAQSNRDHPRRQPKV